MHWGALTQQSASSATEASILRKRYTISCNNGEEIKTDPATDSQSDSFCTPSIKERHCKLANSLGSRARERVVPSPPTPFWSLSSVSFSRTIRFGTLSCEDRSLKPGLCSKSTYGCAMYSCTWLPGRSGTVHVRTPCTAGPRFNCGI